MWDVDVRRPRGGSDGLRFGIVCSRSLWWLGGVREGSGAFGWSAGCGGGEGDGLFRVTAAAPAVEASAEGLANALDAATR